MGIFTLRHTLRSSTRLAQIISVLMRHGFGHVVLTLRLERFVPFRKKLTQDLRAAAPQDPSSIATRAAQAMEDLGPTFIKLGQTLAARPDLVPREFQTAFRRLHDRCRPFPIEQVHRVIESSLNRPISEIFEDFDAEPLATGSIGQVHTARIIGGQSVVVKVRRPEIEKIITDDIALLRTLAELVERHMPQYRMYRPRMLVEQFAQTLRYELDFVNEAAITSRFHESFTGHAKVHTPRVYWDLSSREVLTLERLDGVVVTPDTDFDQAGFNRKELARNLLDAFFTQYFEMGVFHADPHPGNLLAQAPDRWGLIDFGQVGRLDADLRTRLATLLAAAARRDLDLVIDVLDDLGTLPEDIDRGYLKNDVATLLDKYYGLPLKRVRIGVLFEEIVEVARQHRVILPRDFILLGKSLASAGGMALVLDPDCSPVEVISPKLQSLLFERFSSQRLGSLLRSNAYHLSTMINHGPQMLRHFFRTLMRGQTRIIFHHEGLESFITELDRSSNRIAFSVVVASIILGSSIIMQANIGPKWGDTPVLGLLGFVIAGISGLWLLISIFRSGRL